MFKFIVLLLIENEDVEVVMEDDFWFTVVKFFILVLEFLLIDFDFLFFELLILLNVFDR